MKLDLPDIYLVRPDVRQDLSNGQPVVALESAVITHGLPRPANLELALSMEAIVRGQGAIPATIAFIDGKIVIGASESELRRLAEENNPIKINPRNIGIALNSGACGGTTVAATLMAARAAGIKVFATGGIGGVHRGNVFDISADLPALSSNPLVVVCAGAKAILDIPATLENLETRGVPVLGFQTNEFPGFYSPGSGFKVDYRIESALEAFKIASAHWRAGCRSAVLVCNPIPAEYGVDQQKIDDAIAQAVESANRKGISGAALSPFLLEELGKITAGKSLQANLALLKNNALLAAQIAGFFAKPGQISF
ncbi:MAG TPA: pseudouridine-5'-phosphate glycosidase [Anaerolineaceae bacterium]|nr:pseudouridine-5'-phosphate glycosidase [Anaerolineaceae bacterium]HQF69034.1 pseudouridine-5'-phosphate glycosidase [Anaerolineaceae bacterium]